MTFTHDLEQIERANSSGRPVVVFVHGLWLLPSSWDRWAEHFAAAGYAPVLLGWPDDPDTVAEAQAHPEVFAGKSVGQIADHLAGLIGKLDQPPALVGHSFGGLLVQILAGRALAGATVAISPAPFRGVLPLPFAALRSSAPVLGNPANAHRAVPLTYEQFRYAFANRVDEDEAHALYTEFCVPGAGKPIFQAATANINPWTEAKVDTHHPGRGPLLVVSTDHDHTVPYAIARASHAKQAQNADVTELTSVPGRGHSLTIDAGWREVADVALEFVRRHH
ncbi:alpha/beta hydrolase [Streptomyces sp. NPDC088747]|uniref:alpha/beta hydrolase n=1 Tax=Streptomyces sp. NPDC088747 TaxID=3365886 RepID=UPI0038092951